jgi:hypothetical protein
MLRIAALAMMLGTLTPADAATVTGIVTDSSRKPIEGVRIDHAGKMVVVAPARLAVKPSPDDVSTDAEGRFRVVTGAPAIVVRKPGYESQRVVVAGDVDLKITLRRIQSTSRCKLAAPPAFKTREANDSDYTATWFYIETRRGPQGIISGSGAVYSFGAPSDAHVWASDEYSEVMYENGTVDAAGRSPDGRYWRSRSIFGAAAQYYDQDRETAGQLDCVMDDVPVKAP